MKDNYASNLTEHQRNASSRMYALNRAFQVFLYWLSNKENVEACMKDGDKIHKTWKKNLAFTTGVHLWQIISNLDSMSYRATVGASTKDSNFFKHIISFSSSSVSISIIFYLFINFFYYISVFALMHFLKNHFLFKSNNLIFYP